MTRKPTSWRFPACATAGLAALAVAGCQTPGARPEDMPAAAHEAEAAEHGAEAAEHAGRYDEAAESIRRVSLAGVAEGCPNEGAKLPAGRCFALEIYNPTERHLTDARRHEKMANDHAAAATALRSYEEGACKHFDPAQRAGCPLLGQLERVEPLKNGVRLTPKPGVNVAAWQAHIACHLAFAAARGAEGMASCPLGLRGIDAATAGSAVELTSNDPSTTAKLLTLAKTHVD